MAARHPPWLSAEAVDRFRELLGSRLGLAFDASKGPSLASVLRRRLEARGEDVAVYLQRLQGAELRTEEGPLAQELTVPETYFFRNIEQFHALLHVALPARAEAAAGRPALRLLSAGCASGEEAFSLAMTVRQILPPSGREVQIRAVDLNPAALEGARRAEFSPWALRETPADLERAWFRRQANRVRLAPEIARAVQFEQRNLARDDAELWPVHHYDVVFCRNVIMYFTPERARALLAWIGRALVPGGFLFLGHAETARGLSQDFHLCHSHGTFYYQRSGAGRAQPHTHLPVSEVPGEMEVPPAAAEGAVWWDEIRRASERILTLSQAPHRAELAQAQTERQADLDQALDLLARERFAEALQVVGRLDPQSRAQPDVLLLQAVLLAHNGVLAEARAACQRVLALDALNAGAHYVLALCEEAEGDSEAAANHDRVAIHLDPAFAMPRLHLGVLRRRAGDLPAARRELQSALLLLQRDEPARLLLFGGGFGREVLVGLCTAEIAGCGPAP